MYVDLREYAMWSKVTERVAGDDGVLKALDGEKQDEGFNCEVILILTIEGDVFEKFLCDRRCFRLSAPSEV
jgi:hypothetical protein